MLTYFPELYLLESAIVMLDTYLTCSSRKWEAILLASFNNFTQRNLSPSSFINSINRNTVVLEIIELGVAKYGIQSSGSRGYQKTFTAASGQLH